MLHIETTERPMGTSTTILESGTIVVEGLVGTRFKMCSLGIVPEGSEGRKVYKGPLVPGPWGWATTHPLVIDNNGGSAREMREAPYRVTVGEPVTVEGLPGIWTMASPRPRMLDGDGPRLVEYEGEAA